MMRILACMMICLALCFGAAAQLPTSTLNGTVTDPQGGAVANAKITLTNQGTGVSRDTTSDTQGFYTFANAAPGEYSVRVEAPGFAASEAKNIRLEVGRVSTVDVKLSLAKVGQVVTVQVSEVQVDTTQSEVQGLVEATTIANIPLNGRNFLELAFLIPGNRPATNFDPTKTNTLEVSSAGAFGRGGNLMIDGGDNNDEVVGGTLINLPEDSVREFQIATNKFTAEVGRSGSSIINIITKSGTNDLHGSAFLFFRHKTLQGLPATFDRTQPTPSFAREQFGGSAGGALVRDRAWWFASAEYRKQTSAVPVGVRDFTTNSVINSSAPAFLHDFLMDGRVDFKATEKDNVAVRYAFNRSLEIANGSLRKPQGTAANRQSSLNRFNSWLADWTRQINSSVINSAIFHIDYFLNDMPAFSPGDPITNPAGLAAGNEVRFASLQDGANFRIPQSTKLNRYQIRDTLTWVRGKHTLRFGGEWQHLDTYAMFDLFGSGTIYLTQDFATKDLNGDGQINDLDIPLAVALKSAAPSRPPTVPFYPNSYFGIYAQDDWRVLPSLTLNAGLRWEMGDVIGDASNLRPCATLTTADNTCEFAENILGTHSGKDKKQFGPRIGFAWDPMKQGKTVVRGGYGIYYDRVVTEVPLLELLLNGRILPLAAFGGSTCTTLVGPASQNHTLGGCFYSDSVYDLGSPTLANPFSGGSAVFGIGINHIDPKAKNPYVQQFTLGIQQMAGRNWLISADGVHDFGQRFIWGRLLRNTTASSNIFCPNGYDPCTITDQLTGRSDQVTNIESTAKSWYDALLVSVQKRPTDWRSLRWGMNINYTLSKTFNFSNDDQIPFNGAEDAVNLIFRSNNTRLEKGYAPTDERHRIVIFGVFEVPWKISLSPIWTMSSSVPMDSSVPALGSRLPLLARNALGRSITNSDQLNAVISQWNALAPCTSVNQIPCNPGVILNPVAPGMTFGSWFNSFDLRGTKTWTFQREQKLQFIAEVFNLFNVTNIRGFNNNNYSGYNNDITSSTFNTARNTAGGFFGSGGPRAFQFALRYTF